MEPEANGQPKSVCWGKKEEKWGKGKEEISFSLEAEPLSPCQWGV